MFRYLVQVLWDYEAKNNLTFTFYYYNLAFLLHAANEKQILPTNIVLLVLFLLCLASSNQTWEHKTKTEHKGRFEKSVKLIYVNLNPYIIIIIIYADYH
jgi:hypothetical protein